MSRCVIPDDDFDVRLGRPVNRKRVERLMLQMGLQAVYPKPRTSRPDKGCRIYP